MEKHNKAFQAVYQSTMKFFFRTIEGVKAYNCG